MTTPAPLTALDQRLARVFAIGSVLTAACLVSGLVLYFVAPGAAATPRLLTLGLMVLMATPLLRVIVSLAEYVRLRDWFFVFTTVAVLAELTVTMIYALGQR
jgi:uncharacterized membrane protein